MLFATLAVVYVVILAFGILYVVQRFPLHVGSEERISSVMKLITQMLLVWAAGTAVVISLVVLCRIGPSKMLSHAAGQVVKLVHDGFVGFGARKTTYRRV